MLGIVLQLWNEVGYLFGDYWLVVEIVLYWVSSEFLTQMMSSQLVFNLLSSQECIHRLYHWEEWLPSLVWSRSGNLLHQHIKVGLPFDWWLWDLILQPRCQFSLGLVCHRYMNKPTERQTLSFSSWEMVEQCLLSNKDLCSSCFIRQHSPNKVHTGALKLSCLSSWQSVGVCYDKLTTTWLSAPGLSAIGRQSGVVIFPM